MKKMEKTIPRFHYNMGKYFIIIAVFFLSCDKKKAEHSIKINQKKIETREDSVKVIKDTIVFINSTEGENVRLLVNPSNQDSIIESEVLGETGKSEYKFIFNKTLKTGVCTTYKYNEPISLNPRPDIKLEKTENLNSSNNAKNKLLSIFESYEKILCRNNNR